jgi:1-acyl-sn-glycerol-3-phosphate acyltransferase
MGKDSLWKVSLFGRLISAMGAFPVRRGAADREALRRSIEVVERGEPLVLFPEGTRRFGPTIEHLFDGAAYVATRAGVPVVPVGVGGSERAMQKGKKLPRPVKIHIVVGKPLHPPMNPGRRASRRAVRELTEQLHVELQRLFEEAEEKAGRS